jgi:hypothetical protein
VIRLPSPRHLFRPERALLLVVVALLGAMSAPADLGAEGAEGTNPASTTRVTSMPPSDALRWYDETDRRERADLVRQAYAVPLGTVGSLEVGAAAAMVGPRVPWNVPAALWAAYQSAAGGAPASCHLDPRLLAAIGQIESGSLAGRGLDSRGRAVPPVFGPVLDGVQFARIADTDDGKWDGDRTWDRAVGPMQFIPSTWARYGVDADRDGVADAQDIQDAALSAAGYLCAGGRDLSQPEDLREAILAYNHSATYLAAVLALLPNVVPGGAIATGGYVSALEPVVTRAVTTTPVATTSRPSTTSPPTMSTTTTATASTTSAGSPTTTATTTTSITTSSTTAPSTTTTTTPTTTTSNTSTTSTTGTVTTTTSATSTPTTSTPTPDECPSESPSSTATASETTTPPVETTSPTSTETPSPTPTGSCPTSAETTATATASPTTSSANATEAALQSDTATDTATADAG